MNKLLRVRYHLENHTSSTIHSSKRLTIRNYRIKVESLKSLDELCENDELIHVHPPLGRTLGGNKLMDYELRRSNVAKRKPTVTIWHN